MGEEKGNQEMNTENITTVGELIDALRGIPQNMRICGSKPNGHDEYDCEERPFWVKRYYDGTEDGVIYIGIDYKHPN
jgi:hypothetical protein